MTQRGDVPIGADAVSPSQQRRLRAEVDELLTNPALTDADADARINQLLDDLIPEPAPAPAPSFTAPQPPQPLPESVRDHAPLVSPRPPAAEPPAPAAPEPETPLFASEPPLEPGGGQVAPAPARPVRRPTRPVPTPAWEDKYGLWTPPAPPELVVPDDVADIAPVDDSDDLFPDPPADDLAAPETDLYTPPPLPEPAGTEPGPIVRRWKALPSWAQIAIPTAAALSVALLAGAALVGGTPKPEAHPPLTPVTTGDALPPKAVDGPLLPVSLKPDTPPGSSDPGLAFGNDESQAWIGTRLYNVDNDRLTITFSQPVVVSSIFVMPGFKYVEPNGIDHWNEHRLVTLIKWKIGGTEILQNIVPTRAGATLKVPDLATQVITLTIMQTERPPTATGSGSSPLPGIFGGPDDQKVDESWAISRIAITGHNAGGTA